MGKMHGPGGGELWYILCQEGHAAAAVAKSNDEQFLCINLCPKPRAISVKILTGDKYVAYSKIHIFMPNTFRCSFFCSTSFKNDV